MAVQERSIDVGVLKTYYSELASFSKKRKNFFNEIAKPKLIKHHEQNLALSQEKIIPPTPTDRILTNGLPTIEKSGNTRPIIVKIANSLIKRSIANEAPKNAEVQTSQTICDSDYPNNPYLDHLQKWDLHTGEPSKDPQATRKAIIEEMKKWENGADNLPALHEQNNQNGSEFSKTSKDRFDVFGNRCDAIEDKVDKKVQISKPSESEDIFGNSSKDVNKMKVECPHCKKTVVAVRFVPHLARCMKVDGRRCRNTRA